MNYVLQISDNYLSIVPSGTDGIGSYISNNRLIHVTIKAGLSGYMLGSAAYDTLDTDYDFWFTSKYCPLFTTPTRVKLLAGPSADEFIDDTVYRTIYKNSLDGVDLWNLALSTDTSASYWGCDQPPSNIPIKLKRYVECKSAWDLLSIADQSGSSSGGGQLKTLGDMTVKYGGSPGGSADDPQRKKQLYDCWIELQRTFRSVWPAVRGYWDTSKGYAHPVREPHHNRVVRAVPFTNTDPDGPWVNGYEWRGYTYR